MTERVGMNSESITHCLKCGVSEKRRALSGDHMYPSVIISSLKQRIMMSDHPMSGVINSETNLYRFCFDCHEIIDRGKMSAYIRDDPMDNRFDLLCEQLLVNYPITEDDHLRPRQIRLMMSNNRKAIKFARRTATAPKLFAAYPKDKLAPYRATFVSGVLVLARFNQRLDWLRNYDRGIDL